MAYTETNILSRQKYDSMRYHSHNTYSCSFLEIRIDCYVFICLSISILTAILSNSRLFFISLSCHLFGDTGTY